MKRLLFGLAIGLVSVGVVTCASQFGRRAPSSYYERAPENAAWEAYDANAFYDRHGDDVAPGDKAASLGREIWIKATAGDSRFFAYTLPQRNAGKSINWPDMLLANKRTKRFMEYGLINDPDCCSPAVAGECQAKFGRSISEEETFGFDYCPGDDELYKFVGKNGYKDPACNLRNDVADQNKQSSCDLEFGTSTGTVGLRKFPNPRFNASRWNEIGGWSGYINFDKNASGLAAVDDASIEPPFRIGMACAHCHASFSPTRPPMDVNFPKWENINTMVGNQYLMTGQIWASGFRHDHISMQSLAMGRPGTVDTSAVPNDTSGNPGTQNAIINFMQRPLFMELVKTWRKTNSCAQESETCWCEPGKPGKCWQKSAMKEKVPHVLKGGEDSIGYSPAIQRVYFNIGSCSEQCWVNHLTDLLVLEPNQRNFGETPFDIGQCRRDCPNFRAIEDRVETIGQFFFSARPKDMKDVKSPAGQDVFVGESEEARKEKLVQWLENEAPVPGDNRQMRKGFGQGSIKLGARVYARKCASCHSSQAAPGGGFEAIAKSANPEAFFLKAEIADPIYKGQFVRNDWLGNDLPAPISAIGTNSCRARHSNHMKGSVYEEYGSETYRARDNVRLTGGPLATGGRGYMRNISLLNVWAHAPFMHNNAIGPELCGDFTKFPMAANLSGQSYTCWQFDPSFDMRFAIYVSSMEELLTPPANRFRRAMLTTTPIELELVPKFWKGVYEKGKDSIHVVIPAGLNSQWLSGFRHKEFIADFTHFIRDTGVFGALWSGKFFVSKELKSSLESRFPGQSEEITDSFRDTLRRAFFDGWDGKINLDKQRLEFYLKTYGNCVETADTDGHDIGTSLQPEEKLALTAFMALF